ncbi:4-hydroxybenzoyl-CoA thioesterase [Prevotella lacticifex]|uniref:acyl-CoA thioesterase n=1 Tax=Prevotella lacticifex TaxID=2854755 RepID=UPI001CC772CF|nr:thioesterase family protein [Prevotella lacticifex]GJG68170.1 4-hydroxybenzoyl-CoA thioesterase [Prevotella lacticifex]
MTNVREQMKKEKDNLEPMPATRQLEDITRIKVKFSEIDSMRCVWHGSYVKYFEDGRESFGRHYPGIGYADMEREGIYAPVYDLHVHYHSPLGLNDVAVVHTRYNYHPGARLDYEYAIYRESDGKLCCTGESVQLFIGPDGNLMVDLPDYYTGWQKKYLGENNKNQ